LNLVVSSEDVAGGFEKLDRARRELFEHHEALGRIDGLSPPRRQTERTELKRQLIPFFIKTAAVALVGALLIAAANISIIYTLQTAPQHLALYANRVFIRNFANEFERIHSREMTPEREAKIREAIRRAVPILKPYAQELRPLFETALAPSG